MMDLLLRRRQMMLAAEPGPELNYLISGSPTIVNGILTPASPRGFIYTKDAFNPGAGVSWTIQTKAILNVHNLAWRDFFGFVKADGSQVQALAVETSDTNGRYGLYASNNGTSWNVRSNNPRGYFYAGTWRIFQLVCTYSSSRYNYKMGFPETGDWTSVAAVSSHPTYGLHVAFGGGYSNNALDGQFDLSETKIFINDALWWSAL